MACNLSYVKNASRFNHVGASPPWGLSSQALAKADSDMNSLHLNSKVYTVTEFSIVIIPVVKVNF
jgi:hypothetical protein